MTQLADQSALVSGVSYARLIDGPLAGTWVKVDASLSRGIGRAPRPPACRYDDVLTSRRSYANHAITLLDPIYRLPSTYAPLVDAGGRDLGRVRPQGVPRIPAPFHERTRC